MQMFLDMALEFDEDATIGPVGGEMIDSEERATCPFCDYPVDEMIAAVLTFRFGELISYAHTLKDGSTQHHRTRQKPAQMP